MAIVNGLEKLNSLEARGKFAYSGGLGRIRLGYTRLGFYNEMHGVYQRKVTLQGKKTSRMRYYRPTNPQTVPQQAWRANMATMWGVYNTLTSDEKLQLSREARRYRLSGPQLFASRYLKSLSA